MIEPFSRLMQHECCILVPAARQVTAKVDMRARGAWKALLIVFGSHRQCLHRRLGFRLVQNALIGLIECDSILRDVHEEVAAVCQTVVHFLQSVHDKIDRRMQSLVDGKFTNEPVVELSPFQRCTTQRMKAKDRRY